MTLNCAEIAELAGAYALDALPDDETAEVAAHLAGCPESHDEIRELLEVAGILPLLVDEVQPPVRLKSSILAAAFADGADLAPPAPLAPPTGAPRATALRSLPRRGETAPPPPRRARARWLSPALLAAAAVLLVAVGLGALNIALQRRLNNRSPSRQQQAVLTALASGARVTPLESSSGIQAQLVRPAGGASAYVVGTMPSPPAGKAYQAWLIRDGHPVGAGVFKASGFAIMQVQGDLNGAQALAFTIEPDKGSAAPTLPIVAQVAIS